MQQTSPKHQFEQAYEAHSEAIFKHCLMRTYDRELAKDLMQETFIKAWRYCEESGKVIENLRALLYKIATNLIIDHSRKASSKRQDSLEDLVEGGLEPGEDKSHRLKDELDAKEALKILAHIKPEYREVLELRYLNDFSLKQTAAILNISENLVSVRLNRALRDLKKYFKPYERN